eukprot:SAG22_NODE_5714_length_966_cov_0.941176_1_plen_236_part_01
MPPPPPGGGLATAGRRLIALALAAAALLALVRRLFPGLLRGVPGDGHHGGRLERLDPLRAQLTPKKLSALKRQAIEEGAEPGQLEKVLDEDDPKAALISLILRGRPPASQATQTAAAQLRAELTPKKLSALRECALDQGLEPGDLEDLLDEADPKEALICHIVARVAQAAAVDAGLLLEELSELRLSVLQRRAAAAGVGDGALVDALDDDSPKAAVIELIVKAETGTLPNNGIVLG